MTTSKTRQGHTRKITRGREKKRKNKRKQKKVDDKVILRYSCLVWLCEAKQGRFSQDFPGFARFDPVAHFRIFRPNFEKFWKKLFFCGTERFFASPREKFIVSAGWAE